jgi:hypothetical protein
MLSVSTQLAPGDDLATFERMLVSVSFADELVIFNMQRKDQGAMALFKKYRAKIIEVKIPKVVEEVRGEEVHACQGDWILIMDYDEIVPADLQEEIKLIMDNQASCNGYFIPRANFSLGYPLRRGGFERDFVLRLIRRSSFVSWPTNIHSTPVIKGTVIKTTHAMEHHKDASLVQMVVKTNRYSEIEATQFLVGALAPVTSFTLIRKWWMESFRRGIQKGGLLDGPIGLIQSLYQGFSVFISYAKLYELQIKKKGSNN